MEAIWNYFYWQTLSTNALDDMGHILRLNVSFNDCSGYANHLEGQEDLISRCKQWLGPRQPGINEPEPTSRASRASTAQPSQPSASPAGERGRARPRLPPRPMRGRRGALTATPLLVGAVTVLIALVAVFISYSANEGLPFVPTYRIKAELPDAAKLVEGNDVRAGGFRVGQVSTIRSARRRVNGRVRAIAVVDLRLDKSMEPLPVDTRLTVRSRSALGLKYIELVPGRSASHLPRGRHDPAPARRIHPGGSGGRAVHLPARDAGGRAKGASGIR